MIKVGRTWSWLKAKVGGSSSSPKDGPPYKGVASVPTHKERNKARYSIVIMSDSGSSRQVKLSTARIRVAAVAAAVVLGVLVVGLLGIVGLFNGDGQWGLEKARLEEKIKGLEEALQQTKVSMSAQEQKLEELGSGPAASEPMTSAPTEEGNPLNSEAVAHSSEPPTPEPGPLTSATEPVAASPTEPPEPEAVTPTPEPTSPAPQPSIQFSRSQEHPSVEGNTGISPPGPEAERVAIVNFDAKELTAVSEGSSSGKINFRLIKDQPDIRFTGYLFVIVEMVDSRGQNKVIAYPSKANLGPEHLPDDFKAGETLSFRYNSRVELPYRDSRSGASLAGVSILLYGEDGKIVFQRGFDRKQLKFVSAKAADVEGVRPPAPKRRRAL
ncbi:hypothetical protein ACFL2Q_06780 [Thermodesulfobacteriota bacterium]